MTQLARTTASLGVLLLLPSIARPQYEPAAGSTEPPPALSVDAANPPTNPPSTTPPAPPARIQAPASLPPGQWVYTQQYGWIWMPWSDGYTYVPADGYGAPYAYVYYPAYGWTWLVAPWVWGYGPWPYFGVYGPARYAWYGHGWWRSPSRWTWAPARGAYYGGRPSPWGARAAYGVERPAPFRGAVGGQVVPRGGAGGRGWRGGHR